MKRPPYLNIFPSRHGEMMCYFRRNGINVRLPLPSEQGFLDAYTNALIKSKNHEIQKKSYDGTISALIAEYYKSAEYRTLRESTKRGYRSTLEKIRENHGRRLVADLSPKHVRALVNELADNPATANKYLRFLKMVMRFAVLNEWISSDPTSSVKRLRYKTDGYPVWPESEIAKYEVYWPIGTKQRLALALFLYTGQRLADVAKMSLNHIDGEVLRVTQNKGGEKLFLPFHPQLRAAINATDRKGLFLLETIHARPYSEKSLGTTFVGWAKAAGVEKGYSAHGLRKSSLTRLADAGASLAQLMSISGHRDPDQVLHYIRDRDKRTEAQAAMTLLEQNQNTKLQT